MDRSLGTWGWSFKQPVQCLCSLAHRGSVAWPFAGRTKAVQASPRPAVTGRIAELQVPVQDTPGLALCNLFIVAMDSCPMHRLHWNLGKKAACLGSSIFTGGLQSLSLATHRIEITL